jgi:hypothetical protein
LDRLRENLETLDDRTENANWQAKGKGGLQWAKLSRDLVAERNATMQSIKAHLLGRSEVGNIIEPEDYYRANSEVEFERAFQNSVMHPWTEKDLRLECQECHNNSEDVAQRELIIGKTSYGSNETQDLDLCSSCFEKLQA